MATRSTMPIVAVAIVAWLLIDPTAANGDEVETPRGYELAPVSKVVRKRAEAVGRPRRAPPAPNVQVAQAGDAADMQDARVRGMMGQFLGHLTDITNRELGFALQLTKASDDQRKEIVTQAAERLEEAALALARSEVAKQQGARQLPQEQLTIRETIHRVIDASLRSVLDGDQILVWDAEQRARVEEATLAEAHILTIHLTDNLSLDSGQQPVVAALLADAWQESWGFYLRFLPGNPELMPDIGDALLDPVLTKAQRTKLQSRRRIEFGMLPWNLQMHDNNTIPNVGPRHEILRVNGAEVELVDAGN